MTAAFNMQLAEALDPERARLTAIATNHITAVPISAGLAELWRTNPEAALAAAEADCARHRQGK